MSEDDALAALLAHSARGDKAAFEDLYTRVAPTIYGLARRVVRDPALAEEVAQEALVEVWRLAPRFDRSRGQARSWMLTIAHRRAVDRVRSAESARRRDDRSARLAGPADPDPIFAEVDHTLSREQVSRALGALTDLQRESIELAYYQGHSYPEVAAMLEVPLGTVKTRIRDGLIRLRDALGVAS